MNGRAHWRMIGTRCTFFSNHWINARRSSGTLCSKGASRMAVALILSNRTGWTVVGPSSVWRRIEGSAGDSGVCYTISSTSYRNVT